MKIHFLGTAAGMEAMAGSRYASVAIELDDQLLWLDAGEGCAYTGHLMGLDLTRVRHILISHPHMDHVGGLPHLLRVILKLLARRETPLPCQHLTVHLPNRKTYDGAMMLLPLYDFDPYLKTEPHVYTDGPVLDEPGLRITALHNTHLKKEPGQPWQSYSFLIEAENKKIVYSGDVGAMDELDRWADCDLMMAETGHHQPADVARHFAGLAVRPKKLAFVHNGRTILFNPIGQEQTVREIFGPDAFISHDAMTVEI